MWHSLSVHVPHEGNEIGTLLLLFDACEDHLGTRDVLLWVQEIFKEVLVRPDDAGVLVGLRVSKAVIGAGLAATEAPERWSLLGVATLLDGVALSALGLEELGTLLGVTLRHLDVRLWHRHGSYSRQLAKTRVPLLLPASL